MRTDSHSSGVEKVVFESDLIKIGVQRCSMDHPAFRRPGPTQNFVLVFPRSSVLVRRDDGRKFVADSTVVSFWNRNQEYRREPLDDTGAVNDWFAIDRQTVLDVVRFFDPSVEDTPEEPFRFTHAPTDPQLYLSQRQLLNRLLACDVAQPLRVEEAVLDMLRRSVASACKYWGRRIVGDEPLSRSRQEEIVFRAEAVMARCFREQLSVAHIAREAGSSPFHLCRLFKRYRKSTLHGHRNELRLRAALQYVLETRVDLTELSLELGYNSHSHFTWSFRRRFHTTPSALRVTVGA